MISFNQFLEISVKCWEFDKKNNPNQLVEYALPILRDYKKDGEFDLKNWTVVAGLASEIVQVKGVSGDVHAALNIMFQQIYLSLNIHLQYQAPRQKESKFNERNFGKFLIEIYYPFMERHGQNPIDFPKNVKELPFHHRVGTVFTKYHFKKLKKIFEETGVIKLRHISKKADTLILGCGHNRLDSPYVSAQPIKTLQDATDMEFHDHRGIVTVDIDLGVNPDVVADINITPLSPVFKGKKFKRIEYEGIFLNEIPMKIILDILNLLTPDGKIFITNTPYGDEDLTEQFHQAARKEITAIYSKNPDHGLVPSPIIP